jgi:hypothetical protein
MPTQDINGYDGCLVKSVNRFDRLGLLRAQGKDAKKEGYADIVRRLAKELDVSMLRPGAG